MKEVRKEVENILNKTNEMIKQRTDKSREKSIEYKKRDLVWVYYKTNYSLICDI